MESLSSENKSLALDILYDIQSAIEKMQERTRRIHDVDDFLIRKPYFRRKAGYLRYAVSWPLIRRFAILDTPLSFSYEVKFCLNKSNIAFLRFRRQKIFFMRL